MLNREEILETPLQAGSSILAALEEYGLPQGDPDPEKDLQILLSAAAEIEHGLLVQYLYAAYTCTDRTIAGVVRPIATEEMAHFVSVQNLLLAANAPPYLGRYDKAPRDFDPFPFSLEPMTKEVLAKYAACEMPDDKSVPDAFKDVMPQLLADATASAGNMRPHKVGLLYAKIYWLFRSSDDPLVDPSQEPWPDYPFEEVLRDVGKNHHVAKYPAKDISGIQVNPGVWQATNPDLIVATIATREDALRMIASIAGQGEGFPNLPNSHFERFVGAYRSAKKIGTISRPALRDPWYAQSGSKGRPESEVTSNVAIEFSILGDRLYEILLLAIGLSLHPDSNYDLPKRSLVASTTIDMMRMCIKPFVRGLSSLPARARTDSPKLTLCFNLPSMDLNAAQAHARLLSGMDEALRRARALQQRNDISADMQAAAGDVGDYIQQNSADLG